MMGDLLGHCTISLCWLEMLMIWSELEIGKTVSCSQVQSQNGSDSFGVGCEKKKEHRDRTKDFSLSYEMKQTGPRAGFDESGETYWIVSGTQICKQVRTHTPTNLT